MKNALVLGGAGFLGDAIVRALLREGCSVRVLDLRPSRRPGVESVTGDLLDEAGLLAACQGVDTVFHSAALVSMHPRSRAALHRSNVLGAQRALEASRRAGVE